MDANQTPALSVRLLRNATILLRYKTNTFLVDPLLSKKSALDPVPWSNDTRNPTVELPISEEELKQVIRDTDAVLLTHTHRDHWDEEAQQLLPKDLLIVCQPEDEGQLRQQGFSNLRSQQEFSYTQNLEITRVAAQHGHGELADKMAPVSGFVLQLDGMVVYIAGDSVWYEGVESVIRQYNPDLVIVNGGAAQFQFGEPITMNESDVINVAKTVKASARVIVVHMEAINHCYLKRTVLRDKLSAEGLGSKCFVPEDGEEINFR